jgi:ABC-type polysaccharide/polyol phosphate export permease
VLVLGDVFGTLMHHAISFALVLIYCVVRGHLGLDGVPWVVLAVIVFTMIVIGGALLVSVLGAYLPDVAEVIGLGMQILFYGAPIVYPLALVRSETIRTVIELNPLTPLVGVLRTGLIGAAPPAVSGLVYLLGGGLLLLVVGSAAVNRWRASIPDLV